MVTKAEYGGNSIHKLELPILNRDYGITVATVNDVALLKIFVRGYMHQLHDLTSITDIFFPYKMNTPTDLNAYTDYITKYSLNQYWRPVKLVYENMQHFTAMLNEGPADRIYNTGTTPILEGEHVYVFPPIAQVVEQSLPLHIFEYDNKTYLFPLLVSATEYTKIVLDCQMFMSSYSNRNNEAGEMPASFNFKSDYMKALDKAPDRAKTLTAAYVFVINQKPIGIAGNGFDNNYSGMFNNECGIIKEGVLFQIFYMFN